MTQERRERSLTKKDVEAIAEAIHAMHVCRYTIEPQDMSTVADLLKVYKETRSAFIKAAVGLVLTGILIFGVMAVRHGFGGGK